MVRQTFAPGSPAAEFAPFLADARKLAAATTPAWGSAEGDLGAWGPALVLPLLDRSASTDLVVALAAPLEDEGTAPTVMFRTLGLYAVKSRVPFADTPELQRAVDRNLRTIERATSDLEALTSAQGLADWGSVGAGAWLAYLELLYRDYFALNNPGAARWNDAGVRVVDELLQRGRLPAGKGFRRDPRETELRLWPNTLALYALMQAYENQELVRYESAAMDAAEAIAPLRAEDGGYWSDETRQLKDLRANAYLAGALLSLFKDSGDTRYRESAAGILRWLTGQAAVAQDASVSAHAAYLIVLLDSLSTQPFAPVVGVRPMRTVPELGMPSAPMVAEMAARLHGADFRYREMFDGVLHTLIERLPYAAGDVAYDYGDAPGYAAQVLLRAGDTAIAPSIIQRETRLLSWPRPRDFDEISFGASALLAAQDHPEPTVPTANPAAAERAVRRYLLLSGGLAFLDRYYLDWLDWLTGGGGFEYGPTAIGAQIAATHLAYAERFPDRKIAGVLRPAAIGGAILEAAERVAWDPDHHVYRTRAPDDVIALLPNAMMIIDLVRAQRLTGSPATLARAEEVVTGLDPLWDEQRGAYAASAAHTGADGYQSLSTNTYAALALLRLSEATQQPAYFARALRVFDFIHRELYAGGVIYHHRFRGRRATGDIWCPGCNWRVLSVLLELQARLKDTDRPRS